MTSKTLTHTQHDTLINYFFFIGTRIHVGQAQHFEYANWNFFFRRGKTQNNYFTRVKQ